MLRKKNFIFTNRKHSLKGILSSILGIIAIVSMLTAIFLTYLNRGQSPLKYGAVGLLSALYSIAGLTLGILSCMEQDRYHLFSYLGVGLNVMMLAALGGMLYLGM